jgi:hypothetical protein
MAEAHGDEVRLRRAVAHIGSLWLAFGSGLPVAQLWLHGIGSATFVACRRTYARKK